MKKKQIMEKEFVPYELSLELKELGFDEPCLLFIQYSSGTDVFTNKKFKNSIWLGNGYDAEVGNKKIKYKFPKKSKQDYGFLGIPLYQQAFKWIYQKIGIEKYMMPLDYYSQYTELKKIIEDFKKLNKKWK